MNPQDKGNPGPMMAARRLPDTFLYCANRPLGGFL